ncbi:MAG TPA: hypothetical protein VD995_05740 [Azospirillum sp.]|nr:hypothetical protein [Azospirillum sp.]
MGKRHDLWAVAGLLVGRYGRRAGAKAEANAAKAERDGDGEAKAIWTDAAHVLDRHDTAHTTKN